MDFIIKVACVAIIWGALVGLTMFMYIGTLSLVQAMILSLLGAQ
jgi:hypothetical protein